LRNRRQSGSRGTRSLGDDRNHVVFPKKAPARVRSISRQTHGAMRFSASKIARKGYVLSASIAARRMASHTASPHSLILDPATVQIVAVSIEPGLGALDVIADAADHAPEAR